MRVTKRQLRRIIREEKRKVLTENRVRRLVHRALREADDKYPAMSATRGYYGKVDPSTIPDIYSATVRRMITMPPLRPGEAIEAVGRDAAREGAVPKGRNGWGDMRGAPLSGENLTNLEFTYYDFSGADFSGADLSNTIFGHNIDVTGANFTGATVSATLARFIEESGFTGPLNVIGEPDEELEDEGMTVYDWVDLVGRSDSIEQMLGYVEDALGPEAAAEYEFADDGAEIFNSMPDDLQREIADVLELSI
jgi:hypothetical protein